MVNLGSYYLFLGQHRDALMMGERALAFLQHVFPENHPYICMFTLGYCHCRLRFYVFVPGSAMNNLSATYHILKRHEDALVLQLKTHQLELRTLPENHPNIGVTSLWCCLTFNQMLVVLGNTMSNLAASYSELGQHEHAVEMQEKAIEFIRRVLPENHPNIGATWLWCCV